MNKVCTVCGLDEDAHHEFIPQMPDGCQCGPGEWGPEVTTICDAYEGDGIQYCRTCEHDRTCHKGETK